MKYARSAVLALVALALCAAPARLAAQQTPPPRDARPATPAAPANQPVGTAAIGGIVTNDDGSRPVKFAYVILLAPATGVAKVSQTDADGRFLFANLPADRYTVGVTKPPYLGMVAGARRPGRSGTPIAVADGQKITNVAIRMSMGAAITGVIVDEKGQPAPNVSVMAWQWRLQNGERTTVSTGTSVATDDRGRYRVYGLIPGEYLVSANRQAPVPSPRSLSASEVDAAIRAGGAPAGQSPPPGQGPSRYAPVYFPGTARAVDATSIALAAGEERGGVDFKLEATRTVVVSGSIATADGQIPPRLAVSMLPKGPAINQSGISVVTQPDGTFAFPSVMPGTYVMRATGGPPAGVPSGPTLQAASAIVEVSGNDVGGVQLMLRPGVSMAGTVVFRGTAPPPPPPFSNWRLPIRMVGSMAAVRMAPAAGPPADNGVFTIVNVFSGSFVFGGPQPFVFGGPQPFGTTTDGVVWTLESVVVDGRDVTDRPIDVNIQSPPQNVVVTFTDRSQELSGRIMRANGTPAPEYTVVIFPEDKAYWVSGSRRILTVRPGTDGKFVLSAPGPTTLPPGRYLLAAVTDLDREEQYDPSFLNALIPGAVPVTLQPGEKKVQDLRVK